ncbi:MAG: HAMP domain-containing histidine kinase [Ruminococcaceae bacterium]|nr:HAMP domain-containing histidine kinase [Oscillospiraceae bacterium]
MKNSAITRYIARVIIYSVAYMLVLFVLDNFFNGTVIDFLYDNLSMNAFYIISDNRTITAIYIYIIGLVIISAIYVFRLSNLISAASESLSEDDPYIFGKKCPEELRSFSQKLKDFKFEIKENERARQLAEQQKSDLIVYLAHDLKTPLTSVIGYLSLLEESPDMPSEQRAKFAGVALDKAYRLEQLINEFFDITRLNLHTVQTQKSKINLTILLVQILNEFFPMFEEKNINVIENIESEIIIYADADKLARVFDNLFRNAVNYSHNGTDMVCTAYKTADRAIISIKNIGDDIPQEKLERVFEKFYRLDSSRQSSTGGSGLGLAIAKQIVELHGGDIIASCIDGLTEFKVILPL